MFNYFIIAFKLSLTNDLSFGDESCRLKYTLVITYSNFSNANTTNNNLKIRKKKILHSCSQLVTANNSKPRV